MGFPKVFYNRLRRTKGTKIFSVAIYYGLGGLFLGSLIGFGARYTALFEEFRREYSEGLYANTPEYERKRLYLSLGIPIPQTVEQLKADKELYRDPPQPVITN
uniref:Transmembrane protein n=1 Tax=Cuerna arida TaxID=1464854 RepID=A0A1B6EJ93_9HEMI